MATATPKSSASAPKKKLLIPPEEEFWKRYSPHHEAPLSGVSSFALHALAIGLAILVVKFVRDAGEETRPPKVEVGKIAGPGSLNGSGGGGGGSTDPNAKGDGSNVGGDPGPERGGTDTVNDSTSPIKREDLTPVQVEAIKDIVGNPTGGRVISNPSETLVKLAKMRKGLRDQLRRSVNPSAGRGGSGSGGGKDTGKDKGSGGGKGDGSGGTIINEREARVLRWSMTFNTLNGQDYARQLQKLGATLAVPVAGTNNQYRVIHNADLDKRPAVGQVEDVSSINQIYWIDDRPQSVQAISIALGWRPRPDFFVAFFPREREQDLLDKEMAFARDFHKRNNITEAEINETKFDVVRDAASGGYRVVVRSVRLKR